MKTKIRHLGAVAAIVCSVFSALAHAQVNVTTYHNDNSRTGEYTQETVLTPANVSGGQFRQGVHEGRRRMGVRTAAVYVERVDRR